MAVKKVELPPPFDGDDPVGWITHAETYFELLKPLWVPSMKGINFQRFVHQSNWKNKFIHIVR